jgi:glutamyl-tRNA reductase
MTLLVVGVNHRSAPSRVLDQVGLTLDEAEGLSADLAANEAVAEAMVLATCNRVEVYADVTRFHPAVTAVADLLAKWTGCDRATLIEHSYVHFDAAAVAHLFSVAAGLDSMVVGEAQILGQVRATLVRGQDSGTAGRVLNGVGQRALRVGKRVHAETGIDRSGVSVVSVALDAAAEVLGDLAGSRVLVVGAGSMGALAASTLVARGARDVTVANRTAAGAARVAAGIPGGRAIDLIDLPGALAEVDLALCCTGSQDSVIELAVARAARESAGPDRPLVVLDWPCRTTWTPRSATCRA